MKTATKKNPIPAAVEVLDKAKLVKLADIKPSKSNPRKTIDAEGLKALADSIKSHGVLQPILIRQMHGEGFFEIIAGERRYRASKLAGRSDIPACIVKMTDEQAADARLIENDQREDVSPLERAAAYQERLDAGQSIEDLARVVGKSVSSVREALLLGRCPEKLAAAVAEGRVPPTTASLVCRVPSQKTREKLSLHVLAGISYWNDKPSPTGDGSDSLSFRDTKNLIQNSVMIELKGASFDPADAGLVKGAGACEPCPHRLGNIQKEDTTFTGRADICMNPECYQSKTKATAAAKVTEAKAAGRKVLSPGETSRVFQVYARGECEIHYDSPYLDLDKTIGYSDTRTFRQVLKAELGNGLGEQVVIGVDPNGRSHDLLQKLVAKAPLSKHKISISVPGAIKQKSRAQHEADAKAREAKAKARLKVERAAWLLYQKKVMSAASAEFAGGRLKLLRLVAKRIAKRMYGPEADTLCEVMGLKPASGYQGASQAMREAVAAITDEKRLAAFILCAQITVAADDDDEDFIAEAEKLLITESFEDCEKAVSAELDPPFSILNSPGGVGELASVGGKP